MAKKDWYPGSMDARMIWHANLYDQLKNHGFAAKYDVASVDVDRALAVSNWYAYWVPYRHLEDDFSQQLTKYFNDIAGTNVVPAPMQPSFSPTGSPPATDPPTGTEQWVRDLAKYIRNNPKYSKADGEALGIVIPEGEAPDMSTVKPEDVTLSTRSGFGVGVKFRKLGFSAVRVEYRHLGGQWLPGGVLITSPGEFFVAPQTPGVSEQIEVRLILMDGNFNVGQWSEIFTVFVAP